MRSRAFLLIALTLGLAGLLSVHHYTNAAPIGAPLLGSSIVAVGESTAIGAPFSNVGGSGATLSSSSPSVASFTSATVEPGDATVVVSPAQILVTGGEAGEEYLLAAQISCVSPGSTTITIDQGGVTQSSTLTCVPPSEIRIIATPDILACGGTTVIKASLEDIYGNQVLTDPDFHFRLLSPTTTTPTSVGDLVKTSRNTAELTLLPAHRSSTVEVSLPGLTPATIFIQNFCAPEGSAHGVAAVVVSASPNVIDCGGTTTITATARDAAGRIVPGVGFHFTTDVGLLQVSPNNAHTDEGMATLTLQPGMPSAQVIATVGVEDIHTATGWVLVQHLCPGAPTGVISLNASSTELGCYETAFIGANVKDSNGNMPPNGTPVEFITTAGRISPEINQTTNGRLNIRFNPEGEVNGPVKITAASGDSYGYIMLNVKCAGAAAPVSHSTGSATGSSTGSGGTTRPCTPIGDGVCIQAPNTGNRITPPNTGSAGLAGDKR